MDKEVISRVANAYFKFIKEIHDMKKEFTKSELMKICYDLFIKTGILVPILGIKLGYDKKYDNQVILIMLENNRLISCIQEVLTDLLVEHFAKEYQLEDIQSKLDDEDEEETDEIEPDDESLAKNYIGILLNLHNRGGDFEDPLAFDVD